MRCRSAPASSCDPLGAEVLYEVWIENAELAAVLKELGYDSGEVNLKVCFEDASKKSQVREEIIFDVDKAQWQHLK